MVFVAATANRIQLLPAEIIRKGRFDQVFFVDLPNEEERKSIFAIHLKRNKVDGSRFSHQRQGGGALLAAKLTSNAWIGLETEGAARN